MCNNGGTFRIVSGVGPRNTVEKLCTAAMSAFDTKGGNAACSQITLGNLVYLQINVKIVTAKVVCIYSDY